ncbi:MAG: HAD family hydrolase [Candidatus Methylomirabilales bacterium]
MQLILFDIDGTLLTAHGAGRLALAEAMRATYGTAGDMDGYDLRGGTDPRIIRDLLTGAGIPAARIQERLQECFDTYVGILEGLLADGHPVELMAGVADVVRGLSRRPDALLGLLTGNIEAGAKAKLRPTGLLPFFRVGAYGSDHADRRRLPAIACERARALVGRAIAYDRVVVIGDTPRDVDCAQACGARAVAVATGHHSPAELECCRPDLLLPDFQDVEGILAALARL